MFIFQIRSDKENFTKIVYSLSGIGVDKAPVNIFSVDPNTGYVKVHSILDREEISEYHVRQHDTIFLEWKPFAYEVKSVIVTASFVSVVARHREVY